MIMEYYQATVTRSNVRLPCHVQGRSEFRLQPFQVTEKKKQAFKRGKLMFYRLCYLFRGEIYYIWKRGKSKSDSSFGSLGLALKLWVAPRHRRNIWCQMLLMRLQYQSAAIKKKLINKWNSSNRIIKAPIKAHPVHLNLHEERSSSKLEYFLISATLNKVILLSKNIFRKNLQQPGEDWKIHSKATALGLYTFLLL